MLLQAAPPGGHLPLVWMVPAAKEAKFWVIVLRRGWSGRGARAVIAGSTESCTSSSPASFRIAYLDGFPSRPPARDRRGPSCLPESCAGGGGGREAMGTALHNHPTAVSYGLRAQHVAPLPSLPFEEQIRAAMTIALALSSFPRRPRPHSRPSGGSRLSTDRLPTRAPEAAVHCDVRAGSGGRRAAHEPELTQPGRVHRSPRRPTGKAWTRRAALRITRPTAPGNVRPRRHVTVTTLSSARGVTAPTRRSTSPRDLNNPATFMSPAASTAYDSLDLSPLARSGCRDAALPDRTIHTLHPPFLQYFMDSPTR